MWSHWKLLVESDGEQQRRGAGCISPGTNVRHNWYDSIHHGPAALRVLAAVFPHHLWQSDTQDDRAQRVAAHVEKIHAHFTNTGYAAASGWAAACSSNPRSASWNGNFFRLKKWFSRNAIAIIIIIRGLFFFNLKAWINTQWPLIYSHSERLGSSFLPARSYKAFNNDY